MSDSEARLAAHDLFARYGAPVHRNCRWVELVFDYGQNSTEEPIRLVG